MKQFVIVTMSHYDGKIYQMKVSAVDELEALRELYKYEFDMPGNELSIREIYERFFNADGLVSVFEL